MAEPAHKADFMSYEEYLAFEETAEEKHTFWDGEIFSASGGSFEHTGIETNIAALLHRALGGGPCRVHTGNRRLRSLEGGNRAVYPDAVVICGRPEAHPQDRRAAHNPKVVFEVLSPTTESFDRGKKFAYYRTFTSLVAVVLVSQDEHLVECFHRDANDDWRLTAVGPSGTLELPQIGVSLALTEIYDGTSVG